MQYDQTNIAPQEMCRELFYAAYPAALSLLYSGKPRKTWLRRHGLSKVSVSCPVRNGVALVVQKKEILPAPVRMLKELAEEAVKIFWRPVDAHFRKVAMQVALCGAQCPRDYPVGRKFAFNTHCTNELCPAGFATIYPYVRYLERESVNANKTLRIHCPDHAGVLYDLSVAPKPGAKLDFLMLCNICAVKQSGLWGGDKALAAILPEDFCLLAFHSVFAYLQTIASGGWFNWVDHDGKVIVHCPCPMGITVTIGPDIDKGEYHVRVEVAEAGECPRKYEKGKAFSFFLDKAMLDQMSIIDRAVPHIVESFADNEKP
jgi:uncharacterized repeat protein (TIGR04076 family)